MQLHRCSRCLRGRAALGPLEEYVRNARSGRSGLDAASRCAGPASSGAGVLGVNRNAVGARRLLSCHVAMMSLLALQPGTPVFSFKAVGSLCGENADDA